MYSTSLVVLIRVVIILLLWNVRNGPLKTRVCVGRRWTRWSTKRLDISTSPPSTTTIGHGHSHEHSRSLFLQEFFSFRWKVTARPNYVETSCPSWFACASGGQSRFTRAASKGCSNRARSRRYAYNPYVLRIFIYQFLESNQSFSSTTAGVQSSASYTVFPDDYRVPFQKRRLVGIPEGLFQYYNSACIIFLYHKLWIWS